MTNKPNRRRVLELLDELYPDVEGNFIGNRMRADMKAEIAKVMRRADIGIYSPFATEWAEAMTEAGINPTSENRKWRGRAVNDELIREVRKDFGFRRVQQIFLSRLEVPEPFVPLHEECQYMYITFLSTFEPDE